VLRRAGGRAGLELQSVAMYLASTQGVPGGYLVLTWAGSAAGMPRAEAAQVVTSAGAARPAPCRRRVDARDLPRPAPRAVLVSQRARGWAGETRRTLAARPGIGFGRAWDHGPGVVSEPKG
jgi:hypothetical protein